MSVILVDKVKKQFGSQTVLEEINLHIKKGEIIGLLGPSGSGKTTLVKLIIGMGKPDVGSVKVLDTSMPDLKTVEKIGYMAQSDALYEDLNALDNLLFFGALYSLRGKEADARAKEVLTLVNLLDDAKKPIKAFSGGMKRRLSLAIALFHKPQILILDEPTVGIDPVLRMQFWQEFAKLKAAGATILVTTHAMDEAEQCDRLAMIRNGGIIALGSPAELKEKAQAKDINGAFLHFSQQGA